MAESADSELADSSGWFQNPVEFKIPVGAFQQKRSILSAV